MQQIDEEQRRAVRRYAKVLRDLPHLDRSSRHGRVHGFVSRGQQITPEADDKSMRPTSPWEQEAGVVNAGEGFTTWRDLGVSSRRCCPSPNYLEVFLQCSSLTPATSAVEASCSS